MKSPFLLLVVREGREELSKFEIGTRFLGAKFAFSRPGFLSFKAGRATATSGGGNDWSFAMTKDLVFPLRSALFAGKIVIDPAGGPAKVSRVSESGPLPACTHLHAVDFSRSVIAETPADEDDESRAPTPAKGEASLATWFRQQPGLEAALAEFRSAAGNPTRLNEEATTGEGILQLFRVSEGEFWIGVTVLRPTEFGRPGGESGVILPELAPSRAYLKFEEASRLLERSQRKPIFAREERAIEIGCAPGGACFALLERGLRVTGIDRAEMAPIVARNPRFTQVSSSVGSWEPPGNLAAEWLLIDINAEPSIALRESRAVIDQVGPGLKGVFFTLKLNRPEFLIAAERLAKTTAEDLGLKTWFLKQLPSHHQEFGFFGLR
jgi:23S rRNA (cytidine2498-2'-O)-methyltransferase